MSSSDAFLQRLDAAERRLAALAATPVRQDARTEPDATSKERWDSGQVWAHLAEFIPYWVEQARYVAARYESEAVPFGRTKTDPGRLAAIERDRDVAVAVLWTQTLTDMEMLRRFLGELSDRGWSARGLHPTLGVMEMERIVEEFLVGHLEQHADQLDGLADKDAT